MSRPLRIDVQDGWYHVTARGIERRNIYQNGREYEHFLEVLAEMTERYGVEVHAYALMGNHYHLLLRTPHANASVALQWLNVSYSAWFNNRRQRVGHVFQGRFGSVLIDGQGAWLLKASIYIHLNPVRIRLLGLDKTAHRAERRGLKQPDHEVIAQRLAALRAYRWSSYPAYAGFASAPNWLRVDEVLKRASGQQAYRRRVQQYVTRGISPEGFDNYRDRLALGSRQILNTARKTLGRVSSEQPQRAQLAQLVPLDKIVKVVEAFRGERWAVFSARHGDWSRELVFYLARKRSGLTLQQIGTALNVHNYKTVSKALQRFALSLASEHGRRAVAEDCLAQLSNVET